MMDLFLLKQSDERDMTSSNDKKDIDQYQPDIKDKNFRILHFGR